MRVTIAQLEVSGDHPANLVVVRQAVAEALRVSGDLLVLPEYASGYDASGVGVAHAETLDGPFVTTLRELTAGTSLTVVGGMVQAAADGGLPGNVVVVVRGGDLVGSYRKVHLYDAFGHRESDRLAAGDPAAEPLVVPVGDLQVGVMTCYDLRFPESARRLVDAGAQVLVVPAAWAAGPGKVEQWRILAQARAIENVSAVVAVGQAGRGVSGHSLLVGPDGAVAMELGDGPAYRTADVDAEGVVAERDRNPSLVNRRYTVVPSTPA
ncbi:predicted amidohydrolase [Sanguibacter keddieii DSM 10542]|uniref:Predicted amidohydrolase n=1 Tax=Sanguibacter keddieii (strain ATCC 51767 / DSM 10542 / NCFB 3025 / ST-74) TaxID=446469 RepID=D1BBZ6_SANKS|nr:nitrilase-related carbon-nitrogen hydrolase [Sanguibacter keddieii]ACZ20776.1 predicted amidohydrolase [Sanguibacter keddieii DSM 10542]